MDPVAYKNSNGYIISDQGKPPDFVLEVASASTASVDVGEKRSDYAALGIPEYWRFDETGEHHGARLADDRLADGVYVPISWQELPDGNVQGFSGILNLYLRWENGQLGWYDPETRRHITTFTDERERADREHEARSQAESRIQELEAELQRFRES